MVGQDSLNLMLAWLTIFYRQVQFRSRKISLTQINFLTIIFTFCKISFYFILFISSLFYRFRPFKFGGSKWHPF